MRMAQPKSFFRVFTEAGPLIALAVAVALLLGIAGPASAQFFNFGGPPQRPQPQPRSNGGGGIGGWFGGDLFAPFQQQAPQARVIREDFSKAPPPEKRDPQPRRPSATSWCSATAWRTGSPTASRTPMPTSPTSA